MQLLLGLILVMGSVPALAPSARDVVRRLEERYRSAQTLECTFLERYSENGRTIRSEAGKAFFRRPGKMRWEYESPEAKLFVSDGKSVWFYVPEDRTVLRSGVKESTDWRTPFVLLVRNPKVADLCKDVSLAAVSSALNPGDAVLRCIPKESEPESKEQILLEMAPDTGDLVRVLVQQAGAVEIEFRFGPWVRNPPLSDELFRFRPPMGVAIVEGRPQP